MASSYSKLYLRVAHKRHATLQWLLLPFLDLFRMANTRNAALQWLLPILNFTLGWPTKGMLRCGQLVGCCWRRWQVAVGWLVGWLVSRFFAAGSSH